MEQNFHQSIQNGKLSLATDILLNRRIDEDIRDNLTLIKMNGFFIKNKKLKINRHSALDAESAGRKSAISDGSYCLASCQAITDSASSAE